MSVLPVNTIDLLQFCEAHIAVWEQAPAAAIGLTPTLVASFKAQTELARLKYDAAQAARQASKAATTAQNTEIRLMRTSAADLIRQIKAFAAMQEKPGAIYAAAEIPEDQPPQPATAPGKPFNIAVTLLPSGAVQVFWEADNASASSGGFFNISRKLPGQSSFSVLTGANGTTSQSRTMNFIDFTIPASAAAQGVQYIIQGRRGTLVGEASEAFTIQFGIDGAGATVTGAMLMKAA